MLTAVKRQASDRLAHFMLVEMIIALAIAGLLIGGALVGEEVVAFSRVRLQISQIAHFDEAVAEFHEKFGGLPGDLLSASAEREGLSTGDGSPSHGDGDGKISPCNLGWQWHLGCETSLFWAQLSAVGLISENFTADNRYTDIRFVSATMMEPYLPVSPLSDNLFITVWNSDAALASPEPQLPYGNYYEISKIVGVTRGKLVDDENALTPAQAYAIDKKMDDGLPLSGRVVINGTSHWPDDAWGTFAKPGEGNCVASDKQYNTFKYFQAHTPLCHVAIALTCCELNDDNP